MEISVAGVDPGMKNMGIARASLLLVPAVSGYKVHCIRVDSLELIQTEKLKTKVVRQNSDDLRRAIELNRALIPLNDCRVVFAEIPTGAQSARAAFSFGMAVGTIASILAPVIQVQPSETKLATVGTKTASKEEMIEWAIETYPDLPWQRVTRASKHFEVGDPHADNEHLADACAIIHAGVKTNEFLRLVAMMRAAA